MQIMVVIIAVTKKRAMNNGTNKRRKKSIKMKITCPNTNAILPFMWKNINKHRFELIYE